MKKLNYAIVFVSDMPRAVRFYRDTLGLPLKFESPHWTEFSNDGSTIALHQADPDEPGQTPAGLLRANARGTCQLGFHLDNLDDMHRQLIAAGVRCLMEPRTEQFGIRQAVYSDPDGLRFTLAETIKK